MKKSLMLTLLLAGFWQSSMLAQSAHTYWIREAFPDGKGEVVMTLDSSGTGKIWSLADGKLLQTINKKDPEWSIKLLRYKIQHPDYKESGYTYDHTNLGADSFYYEFKTNAELVTRVACKSGFVSGFDRNRASGKIVTFGSDKGTAKVWITDISAPNGPNMRGATKELATTAAEYFHPYFSNKGAWLLCPVSGTLVNVSSGALLRLSKDYSGPRFFNSLWSFNADETTLSLSKGEGAMLVLDATTGQRLSELEVPDNIQRADYRVYPCSDGRSFVYAAGYATNSNLRNRAWIVSADKVIELKD